MIDKTFSPPSEEVRTKLLARSGQCERLVREGDRRAITGVSRTQWWTLERKRAAPARLKLGCNSVAWRLSRLIHETGLKTKIADGILLKIQCVPPRT